MTRDILWAVVLMVVAGACGGRVDQGPESGGNSGQGDPGGGATASQGGVGGTTRKKDRLGDCVPGTPMTGATAFESCQWYDQKSWTCYPTKEAACNCLCPTDVAEVSCISDMPGEGVPAWVYCTSE